MTTGLAIIDDDDIPETKEARRKRLAIALRSIHQQLNSKLLELLDTGVQVVVHIDDTYHENASALIGACDISYQTAPKRY